VERRPGRKTDMAKKKIRIPFRISFSYSDRIPNYTVHLHVLGIVSKGLLAILLNQPGTIAIAIQRPHLSPSPLTFRFDIITIYETVSLDLYNTAIKPEKFSTGFW
jgi:hypothetical protein